MLLGTFGALGEHNAREDNEVALWPWAAKFWACLVLVGPHEEESSMIEVVG